ncbi:hypothetical protein K2173_004844 [Erythroxylum novogranatense]|uniref:DUF4283 domain-containing protein n=1 Tax=Erythroxylum novogranatense TaxID=1862640 RepID=A0AAV8TCY2_9ROSI|nr:hypothetical protein K2173_004844 [Erythroxylum novogranatense]
MRRPCLTTKTAKQKLLTERNYSMPAMQRTLAQIWRLGKGVSFKEVGDKQLLIQFYHVVDRNRVLSCSPWTFNNNVLLLNTLQENENPLVVSFLVTIWFLRLKGPAPKLKQLQLLFFSLIKGCAVASEM